MTRTEVIKKILNESKIINSALKANDIKIVTNALATKDGFIGQLNEMDTSNLSIEEQGMIDEALELDTQNVELMKHNQQLLTDEMNQTRRKKLNVKKQNDLTGKYKNPYIKQVGGSYIDNKK